VEARKSEASAVPAGPASGLPQPLALRHIVPHLSATAYVAASPFGLKKHVLNTFVASSRLVDAGADDRSPFKEVAMADRVKKVNYVYLKVPNRAGHGAKVLGELRDADVNLLAYSGFPIKGGKAQLDLIPESMAALRRIAKKNGWRLSKVKKGFLIQGNDDIGAVHRHINKLAANRINITAADAVAAGKGRYGMILWVRPKDYNRAAKVLRAK
jgi:hypothetical protein